MKRASGAGGRVRARPSARDSRASATALRAALQRIPRRCALKLQAFYGSLKRAQRQGADFLVAHSGEVGGLAIGEFARRAGCSEATAVRLAKRLGYRGFPALKADFAATGGDDASALGYDTIRPGHDPLLVLRKVFDATVGAIRDTAASVERDQFLRAVDAMAGAEKLMFCGAGDAALVALEAHQRFVRIGLSSTSSLDLDLQLITASQLGRRDVLVVFSHSGRTRSVIEVLRVARRRGATVIAITNFPASPIAKRADILLQTAAFSTTHTGEVMSKRVTQLCVLEALHVNVLLRNGRVAVAHLRSANAAVGANKL